MFENAGWIVKQRKFNKKLKFCKFKESCTDEACKSCPATIEESRKMIWSQVERRANGVNKKIETDDGDDVDKKNSLNQFITVEPEGFNALDET